MRRRGQNRKRAAVPGRQINQRQRKLTVDEKLAQALSLFPRDSVPDGILRHIIGMGETLFPILETIEPAERRGELIRHLKGDAVVGIYNENCSRAGRPELAINEGELVEWLLEGFTTYYMRKSGGPK